MIKVIERSNSIDFEKAVNEYIAQGFCLHTTQIIVNPINNTYTAIVQKLDYMHGYVASFKPNGE